ncbi:hypothetical protein ACRRTK_010774 [Alexandromys fortis]
MATEYKIGGAPQTPLVKLTCAGDQLFLSSLTADAPVSFSVHSSQEPPRATPQTPVTEVQLGPLPSPDSSVQRCPSLK